MKSSPRILSLNVRLSEGGAAKVMMSVHEYLESEGVDSKLAYGYGRHGGNSPIEKSKGALRLTNPFRATFNLLAHRIIGMDALSPSKTKINDFIKVVRESDVVHLHAIHSYFWNFRNLVDVLIDSGKPIVWTMHDPWLLSGRCAFNENCEKWLTGCGACPNKNFYPSSAIDFSSIEWTRKRKLLGALQASNRVWFVSVSEWLANDLKRAGFGPVFVIKNGVDRAFWNATKLLSTPKQSRSGVLFINRDLRDQAKVSVPLLNRLADAGVPLTVLGDHAPREFSENIRLLPSTSDRKTLAEIMASHQTLLFTSKVDNYPLTVCEALISGMSVRLPQGKVAREFRDYHQVIPYKNEEDLLKQSIPTDVTFNRDYSRFEPDEMPLSYLDLYREITK